ncbi:MAG: ATP synthase subunit I [Oscillospiraceae bacterium]|nr:ATP synthase subunit I [Oscillospiraceae bacterium]
MAARKNDIITQEMRSLLPYYLVVNAAYFAIVLVLFFALGFDYTLITGAIFGNIVCVLNFYILGITAQIAVKKNAKAAQTYMNTMYCIRYLGLFAAMSIAALVPFINLFTAIIPLLFPKIVITIRTFREKDN